MVEHKSFTVIEADEQLRFNSDFWSPYRFTLDDADGTLVSAAFWSDEFDVELPIPVNAVLNQAAFCERLYAEHRAIKDGRQADFSAGERSEPLIDDTDGSQ